MKLTLTAAVYVDKNTCLCRKEMFLQVMCDRVSSVSSGRTCSFHSEKCHHKHCMDATNKSCSAERSLKSLKLYHRKSLKPMRISDQYTFQLPNSLVHIWFKILAWYCNWNLAWYCISSIDSNLNFIFPSTA